MPIFNDQGFASTVRFVTDKGLVAFKDCFDGQIVKVLTNNGGFQEATVKYLNILPVSKAEFVSNRSPKVINCTDYMPWPLSDGEITDDIQKGDTLEILQDNTPVLDAEQMTIRNCEMFTYGVAICSGTDNTHKTSIHLDPDLDKYLDIFKKAQCVVKEDYLNGYNYVVVFNKRVAPDVFMKAKCWRMLNEDDIRYLFLGVYAVLHQEERRTYLITIDDSIHQMIEEISAVAGYHITAQRTTKRGNRAEMHKYNYLMGFRTKQPPNLPWKLTSMKPLTNRDQKCWAMVSDKARTFILEGGIVACCTPEISNDRKIQVD